MKQSDKANRLVEKILDSKATKEPSTLGINKPKSGKISVIKSIFRGDTSIEDIADLGYN